MRSTLLEISLVSIPADVGALITERGYRSNAMQKHLARLEEFVDTAARHHDDLGRSRDRGDEFGADRAHVRLGRVIRDCQRCFRDIHAQAALDDLQANQFAQNSDGLGKGTSDGRSLYAAHQAEAIRLAPSASQRAAEAAALMPRPPVWDGGSVVHWTASMREYLQSDALARSRTLVRNGIYSYAERQARLRQLSRCP
jgi:hypothetical protein